MGLIRNPTRRTGPRTGAVHVPPALLDRIMSALVKKGRKTSKGLVFKFDQIPPFIRRVREQAGLRVPSAPLSLGTFRVPNYVTGKPLSIPISVTQGAQAGGRTGITTGSEKKLSKAERRQRVLVALQKLRATVSPEKIDHLTDSIFAWNTGIEVEVDLPARPLTQGDLGRARAVLAHELTHVADEAARRYHVRESAKSDALTDVEMVAEELKLGEYVPKRHEEARTTPRHGAEWANDREEVTAMINEIMVEIGNFTESISLFRFDLVIAGRRGFKTRERELISFFRWASGTFAEFAGEWTPKNLNRVLRALWDRYHAEPGFPKSRGVYKNRRTSRRRTSRRRTG
jgi:hypothetical protein